MQGRSEGEIKEESRSTIEVDCWLRFSTTTWNTWNVSQLPAFPGGILRCTVERTRGKEGTLEDVLFSMSQHKRNYFISGT